MSMTPDTRPITWTPSSPEIDEMWSGDTDSGVDPATDTVPDMLATLFAMQTRTLDKLRTREIHNGSSPVMPEAHGLLEMRNVQNRLHEIFGFVIREMGEAMTHLDAKPWKENPRPVKVDEFVEEVTDTFLFFVEFCIIAGITPEMLFQTYVNKTAVVTHRAQNGY